MHVIILEIKCAMKIIHGCQELVTITSVVQTLTKTDHSFQTLYIRVKVNIQIKNINFFIFFSLFITPQFTSKKRKKTFFQEKKLKKFFSIV